MSDAIDDLARDYFELLLEASPTWAHMLGKYDHAGRYEDASRGVEDREIAALRDVVRRAEGISPDGLDPHQQLTRSILIADATPRADLLEARLTEFAADPIFGPQATLPVRFGMLGVPDPTVADAMIDKLRGIGAFFAQLAERQREGVAQGRVSPQFAVDGVIAQLETTLATPAADDPLLAALHAPEGVDETEWKSRLAGAIDSDLRPALAAYRDVLRDEVRPVARPDDKVGLCWLADGTDSYPRTLRYYTTTAMSAQEIHDLGLAQIASLADEYRALGPAVVGTEELGEIFEALRTDPKLHFENAADIVEASVVAMRKAEAALPAWFETLPKAPCAVDSATSGAKAYYFAPAADGSRGGTFFVNVADPTSWGTFEMESLSYHEGVPGHHLQIALAAEVEGLPEFRKHVHNTAYAEGWGLYTERLADEMGLYGSDLDRMGMLWADSMRACRLVVDTGLHAFGWTRQQAVDYMVANSPMSEAGVRAEIDRYILYPGQATSYMIGRLELLRMRAEARSRQRDAFDIKKFHSAVLDGGSMPLGVLDEVVRARLA